MEGNGGTGENFFPPRQESAAHPRLSAQRFVGRFVLSTGLRQQLIRALLLGFDIEMARLGSLRKGPKS